MRFSPSPAPAIALPADEFLFDRLAADIVERYAHEAAQNDLSDIQVIVPARSTGAELRSALARAAKRPVLLPDMDTLKNWALKKNPDASPPFPASARLVLLYEALRERDWFAESARWQIASEMSVLFDEFSERAIRLPEKETAFTGKLAKAYAAKASSCLTFEARVIYELWMALKQAGICDETMSYHARLARIAQDAAETRPLFILLDAPPDEALTPAEGEFLARYGQSRPVRLFYPAPREAGATPIARILDLAWPQTASADTLSARARSAQLEFPKSPLSDRLLFVPTHGRESEAQAIVSQIGAWLNTGLRKIALIAQDRLVARRARASLERLGILVQDKTGWKLSTSRAAATVDALLEVVAGKAYYRDVLDLMKSPHIFADMAENDRKIAVFSLETVIRLSSLRDGLSRMRRALLETAAPACALSCLDRAAQAVGRLSSRRATLAEWLERLLDALDLLGARDCLANDVAGKALLELLAGRKSELSSSRALFSFGVWRTWLNREMESVNFHDDRIESPVALTTLSAACLRRFEAAVLIGGDARGLAPSGGLFFNQAVRRELGLSTHEEAEHQRQGQLALLLAMVPRVVVTWQAKQDGESNPIAPEFALLSSLHEIAWGDSLYRPPLPPYPEPDTLGGTLPADERKPSPLLWPTLIPSRLSVGDYAALVECPYRFFVRCVLGLGTLSEVREEMQKRDYGSLVHRILEKFHARFARISALPEHEALSALKTISDEVFRPEVSESFQATVWKLRWEKKIDDYLGWQRARENQGWRFARSETKIARTLELRGGRLLELRGRIDRIDTRGNASYAPCPVALLDYKTGKTLPTDKTRDDDIQLPLYALMYEEAGKTAFPETAAYLALDDKSIYLTESGGAEYPLSELAKAQEERLLRLFDAFYAGARLPAHGAQRVCGYCEARGLCRTRHV